MASEKINALIEEVKSLSVLELAELVHALKRPSAFPPLLPLLLLPPPALLRSKRRPSSMSS